MPPSVDSSHMEIKQALGNNSLSIVMRQKGVEHLKALTAIVEQDGSVCGEVFRWAEDYIEDYLLYNGIEYANRVVETLLTTYLPYMSRPGVDTLTDLATVMATSRGKIEGRILELATDGFNHGEVSSYATDNCQLDTKETAQKCCVTAVIEGRCHGQDHTYKALMVVGKGLEAENNHLVYFEAAVENAKLVCALMGKDFAAAVPRFQPEVLKWYGLGCILGDACRLLCKVDGLDRYRKSAGYSPGSSLPFPFLKYAVACLAEALAANYLDHLKHGGNAR
jgi:hypothetical protein